MIEKFLGLALYAILSKRFPCENAIKALELFGRPAIAAVSNTFGQDFSCVNKFISRFSDRRSLILIYLDNGFCRRHRVCGNREIYPRITVRRLNSLLENNNERVLRKFKNKLQALVRHVVINSDNTVLMFALGLEDNFTYEAAKNLSETLKTVPGEYSLTRNPMGHYSHSLPTNSFSDYLELHGLYPPFPKAVKRIRSLDGLSIEWSPREERKDINISTARAWLSNTSNSYARFLWRWNWQKPGTYPVRKRHFEFTKDDIELIKKVIN